MVAVSWDFFSVTDFWVWFSCLALWWKDLCQQTRSQLHQLLCMTRPKARQMSTESSLTMSLSVWRSRTSELAGFALGLLLNLLEIDLFQRRRLRTVSIHWAGFEIAELWNLFVAKFVKWGSRTQLRLYLFEMLLWCRESGFLTRVECLQQFHGFCQLQGHAYLRAFQAFSQEVVHDRFLVLALAQAGLL